MKTKEELNIAFQRYALLQQKPYRSDLEHIQKIVLGIYHFSIIKEEALILWKWNSSRMDAQWLDITTEGVIQAVEDFINEYCPEI